MRHTVTFMKPTFTEDEYSALQKGPPERIPVLVDVMEAPSRTALSRDGYKVDYDVSIMTPKSGRMVDLTEDWTVNVPGYGDMNIQSVQPLFHSVIPNWRITAKRMVPSV